MRCYLRCVYILQPLVSASEHNKNDEGKICLFVCISAIPTYLNLHVQFTAKRLWEESRELSIVFEK